MKKPIDFLKVFFSRSPQQKQHQCRQEKMSPSSHDGSHSTKKFKRNVMAGHIDRSSANASYFSEVNSFSSLEIQQLFEDQYILNKKIQKIRVENDLFDEHFSEFFSHILQEFNNQFSDSSFARLIYKIKVQNHLSAFRISEFHKQLSLQQPQEIQQIPQKQQNQESEKSEQDYIQNVQTVFKKLIYFQQNLHLIYSFDFTLCTLSFLCLLLFYWAQLEKEQEKAESEISQSQGSNFNLPQELSCTAEVDDPSSHQIHNFECKNHFFSILKLYIDERSQSINVNSISIKVVYCFLNYLKQDRELQLAIILKTQQKLIKNIRLFRRFKKMETEYDHTKKVFLESQMRKFEEKDKLTNLEETLCILQLISMHNFVAAPLQKYYQVKCYSEARSQYQNHKDCFSLWVFQIIVRVCERNNQQSLPLAARYVVVFMGILKRFKEACNIEGIATLVTVLHYVKQLLPKIWKYAIDRRPQIDKKLAVYSDLLATKAYKIQTFPKQSTPIVWEQTIYEFCGIIKKSLGSKGINIKLHQNFHNQFLRHLIYHRDNALRLYEAKVEQYCSAREIGISLNMYLLQKQAGKIYAEGDLNTHFNLVAQRAKKADDMLSEGMYIQFIGYIFYGHSQHYQQVDL